MEFDGPPVPWDYVSELMHRLQMVGMVSLVKWHTTIHLSPDRYRTAVSAGWRQARTYASRGDIPGQHPNSGTPTVAQDQLFLRQYDRDFPSIKKSKQYTAKRLLDEIMEGIGTKSCGIVPGSTASGAGIT